MALYMHGYGNVYKYIVLFMVWYEKNDTSNKTAGRKLKYGKCPFWQKNVNLNKKGLKSMVFKKKIIKGSHWIWWGHGVKNSS